jgi:hypothetical protein
VISENESDSTDVTGSNPALPAAQHTLQGPPPTNKKRETSLFLSGSEPFNKSSYAEPTGLIPPSPLHATQPIPPPPPLHYQPYIPTPLQPLGKQRATVLWLLIAIPWVLVAILLFCLIFLSLPSHSPSTVVEHSPTPAQTTVSSTQAVGNYTSTTNQIAVQPTHFNAGTDCQVDNGYRCTATVFVSNTYQGNLLWQASGDGALTRFSPGSGTFTPGQQQQVIIYIHNTCPASGLFTFSTGDNQVTVPWNC